MNQPNQINLEELRRAIANLNYTMEDPKFYPYTSVVVNAASEYLREREERKRKLTERELFKLAAPGKIWSLQTDAPQDMFRHLAAKLPGEPDVSNPLAQPVAEIEGVPLSPLEREKLFEFVEREEKSSPQSTPRTDAFCETLNSSAFEVTNAAPALRDFARTLERELNAANNLIDGQRNDHLRHIEELAIAKAEIERLKKELNK